MVQRPTNDSLRGHRNPVRDGQWPTRARARPSVQAHSVYSYSYLSRSLARSLSLSRARSLSRSLPLSLSLSLSRMLFLACSLCRSRGLSSDTLCTLRSRSSPPVHRHPSPLFFYGTPTCSLTPAGTCPVPRGQDRGLPQRNQGPQLQVVAWHAAPLFRAGWPTMARSFFFFFSLFFSMQCSRLCRFDL